MVAGDEAKGSEWIDEDDAPDLSTPEWAERLRAIPVTRGRPILDKVGEEATIAIDADVIERFRQGGAGWQSRINAALREWLDTH